MNFYRPLHLIFGEYVFSVKASDFSRLAAAFTERHIHFWGSRAENGNVIFFASVFSAESVDLTARELDIPLESVARRGLPFIFARYRKRYGLILGMFVAMFLLFYSQLFVWKIEISGNVEMTVADIELALSQCGISVGCYIPSIDTGGDANRLLMNCHGLSSAAISINGTHLYLSVLERRDVPEIINEKGFFNVVSLCDGIILDIDAADGTPEVREGDVVYKGQLLINSFMERSNGSFHPTHARGTVYAAVEERFVSEIPLSRITRSYTGRSQTKYVYNVLGTEIPSFSGGSTDYEYFDAVTAVNTVKLFGFIELPVREIRITYMEYIPIETQILPEEAEILAREELSHRLAETDLEVLSCESEFYIDKIKGVCILKANALFKQEIGVEVPYEILNYRISERFPIARE